MTLLAALRRRCSPATRASEDVVVGSPIAGRNRGETEGLIGFFVNTLVLRADLDGRAELPRAAGGRCGRWRWARTRTRTCRSRGWWRSCSRSASLSRTPLFQVMFALQNLLFRGGDGGPAWLSTIEEEEAPAKFDLTLDAQESGEGIDATFVYNPELFDAATVEGMAYRLRILLDGSCEDPERPVSALPITSEEERQHLLGLWRDSRAVYEPEFCLHWLFEAQALRAPGAVAISFEGRELSYGELNRSANRLAHHLRGVGVGPSRWWRCCWSVRPKRWWRCWVC